MENAVKALLMVAGLIIGVLVIGLLVYLFRMGGNVGSNFEQSMSEGEIASFNAKFEPYIRTLRINTDLDGDYKNLIEQESNTINDVVSVINLAYDANAKVDSDNSEDGIAVMVDLGADGKYYMNANLLYHYFEETRKTSERRLKNFVFFRENYSSTLELNDLIKKEITGGSQLNDTRLYSNNFSERIYRYYFDCTDIGYSVRHRINKLTFKLVDAKQAIAAVHSAEILSEIGF